MLGIRKLFEWNLKLLNSDIEDDKDCIDYLDFSKEFRYQLKSDGSILTSIMDKQNQIESGCKKVPVDKGISFVNSFLDKISKILINNQTDLKTEDFNLD